MSNNGFTPRKSTMNDNQTILFDLDGTLIDSSKSILTCFSSALSDEEIVPAVPLTDAIIGPPLMETLALLAGTRDNELLDRLADRFKRHYDTEGFKETIAFDGIAEMLACLTASGIRLHIATNKRLFPTLRILEHLNWMKYFGEVFALDRWKPSAINKTKMLKRALDELDLRQQSPLYVGDRQEDADAAGANNLPFALAQWGYNNNLPSNGSTWLLLGTPADLTTKFCCQKYD